MKKELHPALIIAILVLVVGGVIGVFALSGRGATAKVNVESLDPESLRDPDPRGNPAMRARPEGD